MEKKVYPIKFSEPTTEAQSLRKKYRMMPLEYMLEVLNDEGQSNARRDKMAKAAAPYLHQHLVAVKLPPKQPWSSLDLRQLTDQELMQLEQIYMKAVNPWSPFDEDEE